MIAESRDAMRNLSFVALMALLGSSQMSAQAWQASAAADAVEVRVENADGYGFEVGPASGRRALCTFRLPEGSADQLDGEKLPMLVIGGYNPQQVLLWPDPAKPPEDGGDFNEVARRSSGGAPLVRATSSEVTFSCWLGLKDQLSPTRGPLRQIMDGEELLVRFYLSEGGSDEAVFPLEGAREVIAQTLGITEQPSDKDLLQDELLRFRVQYRSSTCYLLAGKKNRKRCLEAVNRCAQTAQESVVANLGCIEVE